MWFLTAGQLLSQNTKYDQYIRRYSGMAVEQMNRYGIPASITLAQGLLESGAGTSRLATQGNNHFGIKVSGSWDGPYMIMADDCPNDRFRVYDSAKESYEDHSLFLRNNRRYACLFDLKPHDYKGWAHGLKKAGYATNPAYASSLITLIERYHLTEYDRGGSHRHHRHSDKKQSSSNKMTAGRKVYRCNGQYYILAQPGDTYAGIARLMKEKEEKLRKYNDVDSKYSLKAGDVVYLGKKARKADGSMKRCYHVMEAGESLYSISQRFGIRLKSLIRMNPVKRDYRFKVGDEIKIK